MERTRARKRQKFADAPKTTPGATTSVAANIIALVFPTLTTSRNHTARLRVHASKEPPGTQRQRNVKSGARESLSPYQSRPRITPAAANSTSSGTAQMQRATSTARQCPSLVVSCQSMSASALIIPAGAPSIIGVYHSASCLAILPLATKKEDEKMMEEKQRSLPSPIISNWNRKIWEEKERSLHKSRTVNRGAQSVSGSMIATMTVVTAVATKKANRLTTMTARTVSAPAR